MYFSLSCNIMAHNTACTRTVLFNTTVSKLYLMEGKMSKKKVFIAWSGPIGKRMAEGLRDTLLKNYPELEAWVSSKDISLGSAWFDEIKKALAQADSAIGCLTPGSSKST